MVLSWKQRMMGCVNLPHDPVAPALKPNVLIINRPVNKGRGFLNIAETVSSLKVKPLPTWSCWCRGSYVSGQPTESWYCMPVCHAKRFVSFQGE